MCTSCCAVSYALCCAGLPADIPDGIPSSINRRVIVTVVLSCFLSVCAAGLPADILNGFPALKSFRNDIASIPMCCAVFLCWLVRRHSIP
jgi:hypothetical protein